MAFVQASAEPQGEFKHSIFRGPNGDMPLEDRKVVAESLRKALSGEYGMNRLSVEETTELRKSVANNIGVNVALSLYGIPLQVPAKMLYTVISPWRNKLPRSVVGGVNFSYRKITGINTKHVWGSVPEATPNVTGRNTRIAYNAEPLTSVNFKTLEMESILTREALFGGSSSITPGQDFAPMEFMTLSLLQSTFMAEEYMHLFGNVTTLGKVSGVTEVGVTQSATATGGLTPATNYYVYITPLTGQGLYGGSATGDGTQAKGQVAALDSTGEGTGDEFVIATEGGGGAGDTTIKATWTDIPGAVAYNCYIGATTGIANAKYAGTTYYNTFEFSVAPGSLAASRPNGASTTANAYDWDGFIAQLGASALGGQPCYYKALNNASLTGDSTTGVQELDDANLFLFDQYKTGVDEWWVNPLQKRSCDKIILGSTSPYYRLDATAGDQNITGGLAAGSMMNRFTGQKQPIIVHPNLPPGMMIGMNHQLGAYYPNANVGENVEVKLSWDYAKTEFAMDRRAIQPGIDMAGALVTYAPFAHAIIKGAK
jgi:hypothetical protein